MSQYLILYLIIGGICNKYFPKAKAPSTARSTKNSYGEGMHLTSTRHSILRNLNGLHSASNGGSANQKEAVIAMISTGFVMSSMEHIPQASRRIPSSWPKSTFPISNSSANN